MQENCDQPAPEGGISWSAERLTAVVFINWNHAGETIRCVNRVLRWRELRPDVLVVDNASEPADRDLLAGALAGRAELVFNQENGGFAGGSNRGIEKALEKDVGQVALCNYDADFAEETLIRLIDTLARYPEIGAVGPVLREGERRFAGGRDIGRFLETRRSLASSEEPGPPVVVDYVPGTLIVIRRSVFEQCGLLDEDYFFSGEVADYCRRIRDRGWKCAVNREVAVNHDVEKSGHRNDLYPYYSFRNRFLFVRKHYRGLKSLGLVVYWSGLTAAAAGRAGLSGNRLQARALLLAGRDGLLGRWGDRNGLFIPEEAP